MAGRRRDTGDSQLLAISEDSDVKGTNRSAMRVVVCGFVLGVLLAATMAVAGAANTDVSVNSRRLYTDTGVTVRAGDTITIKASGFIHFGAVPIDHLTPAGIQLARCETLTASHTKGPRPAPTLDCWSLIGKIGVGGEPFAVGDAKTVRAATSGKLLLGVNDNLLGDNQGAWIATVTVEKAATATSSGKKSSSSTLIVVIGGLLIVAVLLGVVVMGRKRQRRKPKAAAARPVRKAAPPPPPPPAPIPAPVAPPEIPVEAGPVAATRPTISLLDDEPQSQSVTDSPAEGDFTDVNIFEVEFPDNTSLRVGYNHFPEGTLVRFRIAQRARGAATGSFVANGGGSRYHFVTVDLGQELEPNPDGADVSFTWAIGGVPFQYSVRRVPAS